MMANRMLHVVAEAHSIDSRDLHVTTSIGVSVYPEDGQDADALIKNADTAMYQAKENGRQKYQFFKPAMYARAVERQSVEEGLRRALERHEFVLHYQPIIDLTTGEVTGTEALLRWAHPTRGLLLPSKFIPIAEDCGLIVPIGKWVLRQACDQARAWTDAGLPAITMAVNVSAMEFADETFLNSLFAVLSATGIEPRSLRMGCQGRDRRLRYGLLKLELSAEIYCRCSQDRSILRPPDRHRRSRCGHRHRGDQYGAEP
jgi:predicted signal transduction protein with EAL and GGDEF domain